MEGNGEAELYAVQQERSHNVTSIMLVGCGVIIVDIGWFLYYLITQSDISNNPGTILNQGM